MKELTIKIDIVDVVVGRLGRLPIQKPMYKVNNLEKKFIKIGGLE